MYENNDCRNCIYYEYDEDVNRYECGVSLDEDEYARVASASGRQKCPYFRDNDEYKTVRKQI